MTAIILWRLNAPGVEPIAGMTELLEQDTFPVSAAVRAIEKRFDLHVESLASLSHVGTRRRYRVKLRAGRKVSRGALLTVERAG